METKVSEASTETVKKFEELAEKLLTTKEEEERQESCHSILQLLIEKHHEFQWDNVKMEGNHYHNEYRSGIGMSLVIINLLKSLDNRYRFCVVKSGLCFSLVSVEYLIPSGHTISVTFTSSSESWPKKEIGNLIKDLYEKVDNREE